MNHNFRKGPDDANGIIWASAIVSALGIVVGRLSAENRHWVAVACDRLFEILYPTR